MGCGPFLFMVGFLAIGGALGGWLGWGIAAVLLAGFLFWVETS